MDSYRVLLVEDNEDDYLIVRDLLGDISTTVFELSWVDSYGAARESLLQNAFDVCLIDYRLGEATGVDLAREFAGGATPFILLTGNENYEVDVEAGKTGVADYLLKGHINAPLLERSIRYAVERKKTEIALLQAQRFAQATVDALPHSIAVLDENGTILAVNTAWRDFATSSGDHGDLNGVGANYLGICDYSNVSQGHQAAAGIRALIAGEKDTFVMEYPCQIPAGSQNPAGNRWFRLSATRFAGEGPLRVAVAHEEISNRKEMEQSLQRERDFVSTVVDTVASLVIVLDVAGRIVRFNHFCEQLTGYDFEEVRGREFWDLFLAPAEVDFVKANFGQLRAGHFPNSNENFWLTRSGEPRLISWDNTALLDDNGVVEYIIGTGTDITERRQAQESLRQSNELLRAVTEGTSDAIFAKDAGGRYLMINAVGAEFLGRSAAEIVGKTDAEIIPSQAAQTFSEADRHVLKSGEIETSEETGTLGGVSRTYLATKGPLRGPNGDVVGIVGIARDISERKRAEEILEAKTREIVTTWESMTDAFFALDTHWRFTHINSQAAQLWRREASELIGKNVWEEFPSAVDSVFYRQYQRAVSEQTVVNFEAFYAPHHAWREVHAYPSPVGLSVYFRDITRRKNAESALRASEARSGAVIQYALDCIITIDHERRVIEFNPAAEETFGYSRAEALGQDLSDLIIPPRFREAHQRGVERFLETGEGPILNERVEVLALCKDGREITVELAATAIQSGETPIFIAYLRDITERKRAEDVLRASQEQFQSIVANVPGMVYQFEIRPDGTANWPFLGEGCRELFEMEPETAQRDPQAVIDATHPDYRDELARSLADSAQTLLPWTWEGRLLLASGKNKWIQGASRPQRTPDGGTLWNGLVLDITARKEAEDERDRFWTISLDMLGIFGLDGRFKRLNPAFLETLGYTDSDLVGQPVLDWVHPDDLAATIAAVQMLSEKTPVTPFENRFRTRSGEWRWLEWKSVAVPEEGLIYAAARDISERKAAETSLLQMRDELEMRVDRRTAQLERSNATLQNEILERERAERAVRVQARQHEAVADLGRRALLDLDLDTLLQGAVALISATLDVEICFYFHREGKTDALKLRAEVGLGDEPRSALDKTIGDNTQVGQTALLNEPILAENLLEETRFVPSERILKQGITSTITMPVYDSALYGVLAACSRHKQKWSQNEVFFLQNVANVLSGAIARKQAEAEIHQLNADLHDVNDELRANESRLLQGNQISTDLMRLRVATHEELYEAIHQITEAASALLEVQRSSVWLFGDDGFQLRCFDLYERLSENRLSENRHSKGRFSESRHSKGRHSEGVELSEDGHYFPAIKTQRIVVADDVQDHPMLGDWRKSYLQENGITALLDVALVVGGKNIGVLCCEQVGAPRAWQAQDRTFATAIASVCSLVLESYERTRAENALQAAKEEAEHATKEANAANLAKSEFLSRMSHELRTPLNAILGFGQILEMRGGDERQNANVAQILKAGRHLLNLINEVLDIARIEAGHLSLSLEPIHIGQIVRESLDLVRPLAAARHIHLENEIVGVCAENYLLADQQRLKQVLLNLLSNAVKYNREGGSVFVSCQIWPGVPLSNQSVEPQSIEHPDIDSDIENPGHLRILVRDTGAGLSPDDIAKLFMPFERLGAAASQIEGTGIGLMLCKRLVEAMDGRIGIESGNESESESGNEGESENESGSTFWVEMPLATSPAAKIAEGETVPAPVVTTNSGTILYIEDNLSNINLIEQVLADFDYHLLTAMQGRVGLELASQHHPDFILLDIHLPDINGDVVLRHLKDNTATRDIPVVILSADATPSQIERLLAAGAEDYLTKPLDLKQFFSVLEKIMSRTKRNSKAVE